MSFDNYLNVSTITCECTEKPAMGVGIAPSQRCATPHHKPKTSWKKIVYTKKIQGPKHQNHYKKPPLEEWLQNSQGESKPFQQIWSLH